MNEEKPIEHHYVAPQPEQPKRKVNYWMISTLVLVLLLLAVIIFTNGLGFVKSGMSKEKAGEKAVAFINDNLLQGQAVAELKDITDEGNGLYNMKLKVGTQEFDSYITKDGQFFFPSAINLEEAEDILSQAGAQAATAATAKEVPKTAKPKVEAFVFSYCPYGVQFEKALAPVYDLLESKADINIVAIGAMHGEYEKTETLRQVCIEKLYGKDKLFKYLNEFNTNTAIGACRGTETCVNPLIEKIYSANGLDKAKIEACMDKDALTIYESQMARAQELGISGSPGFVINGVQVSVNRAPEAIKTAICNAFETEPSECSKALSATAASAGFGSSVSAAGAASASCE